MSICCINCCFGCGIPFGGGGGAFGGGTFALRRIGTGRAFASGCADEGSPPPGPQWDACGDGPGARLQGLGFDSGPLVGRLAEGLSLDRGRLEGPADLTAVGVGNCCRHGGVVVCCRHGGSPERGVTGARDSAPGRSARCTEAVAADAAPADAASACLRASMRALDS